MKRILLLSIAVFVSITSLALADTFGTGNNQFNIDFVTIAGDASSANGTFIGGGKPEGFTDPSNNYRIGKFEITNDQWDKFTDIYGTPIGNLSDAYNQSASFSGTDIPANYISWYEAAQFVNWLNTSTGHQAAYKFTGTKGTSDYTFTSWEVTNVGYNASNPFRNSNAFYFLPTRNEWLKSGYWSGMELQMYTNISPDDLVSGEPDPAKWNYGPSSGSSPWNVGSGSEELNGTFDMMGNVWEWMESPFYSGDYSSEATRDICGGSYYEYDTYGFLRMGTHLNQIPFMEEAERGFRVASIPEPASLLLFGLGVLLLRQKS